MIHLNLGCGDKIRSDSINVDIFPYPGVNMLADLTKTWPWKDSSIFYIVAQDIIEHLPDKIHTMNEAYRILCPGGIFHIEVPTTNGMGAFQDPTHVSYWNENSFRYYESGSDYRNRFTTSYGIQAKFKILKSKISPNNEWNDGEKLEIILIADKP